MNVFVTGPCLLSFKYVALTYHVTSQMTVTYRMITINTC